MLHLIDEKKKAKHKKMLNVFCIVYVDIDIFRMGPRDSYMQMNSFK